MPPDTLTGYPLGALSHTQRVPGRGAHFLMPSPHTRERAGVRVSQGFVKNPV